MPLLVTPIPFLFLASRRGFLIFIEVDEVFCLSQDAVLLLNHFKWNDQDLKTQWFDKEAQVSRQEDKHCCYPFSFMDTMNSSDTKGLRDFCW